MKKKHVIPAAYQEQPWLRPEDICSILGLSADDCHTLLSRNMEDSSYPRDFYVGPMHGSFKVEAQSFWQWYSRNYSVYSD